MIILETARLRLEILHQEHLSDLIDIWTDEINTKYMGGPRKVDALKKSFSEDIGNMDEYELWPVCLKQSGRVVGYSGIIPKVVDGVQMMELIYLIDKEHCHNGFGFEISTALIAHATNKLKLTELIAIVEQENIPSVKLAIKLKFNFVKLIVRDNGTEKQLYRLKL